MRSIVNAIATGCAMLFCASAAAPERIDYTLTPILENGALTAVQVDVRFRGEADGETQLALPDSWGGYDELWRSIDDLAAVSGATLHEEGSPGRRNLRHRPDARIHIRYRVVQDWQGEPAAGSGHNPYRAIVQPGYFHLIGHAALITPRIDEGAPVRVRIRNLPRDWSFASDLEHDGLTLADVGPSIAVGGDFRVIRTQDANVRVAVRGTWQFSDEALSGEVLEILSAQRRFWSDSSTPFLVTVIQLATPDAGWRSVGGTGLGDAFGFFATSNSERERITRLLAHEGLHTWIPHALGGLSDNEAEERASYWFSEGFTDFYTARLLVREHVWTPTEFAADLNELLRVNARLSVRAAPNARIVADFWTNQDVQILPYQRGRLLATLWDARLRFATEGARDMDDVMYEMRRRAQSGSELHADQLFPVAAAEVGLALGGDLAQFVERGEIVLLSEQALAPCGRIVTREVANFHRGFDIEATQANNNIIAGVDPELPAYAAGVRNGMTLVRRDAGEIGDSEQEIAYVVRDGETERTIRYMPRGRGSFILQQFELEPGLSGERLAQCIRVLGGS